MTTRIGILLLCLATNALAAGGTVMVSADEARRLLEEGRMELIESDVDALWAEREERRRLERSIVEAYLASHPEDEPALRLLLDDDRVGPRTMSVGDERDPTQTVTLQGTDVIIGEMAQAIVMAADKANVLGIYARLWAWAEPSGVLRDGGLPTPEASETLTVDEIKRNTSLIVAQRLTIKERLPLPPNTVVEDFPDLGPIDVPDCIGGFQADAGNGSFGDQYKKPGQVCTLSPTGILANDARPYRNHLSCVRHQAKRGTCGAFAVASALEAAHSRAHAKRVNLSEQMLYFRYKSVGIEKYDLDGMDQGEALERFVGYQTTIPFELAWNYNRSWDRKYAAGELVQWKDSCKGYGEACSDTTPQGTLTCFRKSPRDKSTTACGLVAPPNVGGVRLTIPALSVWEKGMQNESIEAIKALLDAGMQITLSISVTDTFKAAGQNGGWLSYSGAVEDLHGGHAVHVVHYIENDELAEILPDAPPGDGGPYAPEGDIGGYFIVRNSWGQCWGDGGYVYIPYRWLRNVNFVHAGYAIDPAGVQPAP